MSAKVRKNLSALPVATLKISIKQGCQITWKYMEKPRIRKFRKKNWKNLEFSTIFTYIVVKFRFETKLYPIFKIFLSSSK